MATVSTARDERPYIDGEWESGDGVIEVDDLAEDGVFGRVTAASPLQAGAALDAAENAQAAMADSTIPERVAWLEAIAAGLRDRKDELVDVIVREAGKPVSSARGEVESAAERFERAVEEARGLSGEFRPGTTAGHEGWEAITKPEPRGTVLCITPYNYPLSTTALQVAPALAAGNSVVLKPASKTPVSAAILTDVIASTDVQTGGFNFVPGHASTIGDVLAGSDQIDAIAMTGSSGAGEHVARQSGIVNLHMELGGNAPAVVFPDADLDEAAAACAKGGLKYAGQRCSAISRVLVHESIHDDLVERIENEMDAYPTGDLFDEQTALGPLISDDQADWVEELVTDATDRGAEIVRGGGRDGQFVEPTLLGRVPESARLVTDEQFGPVIPVTTFADEDHAIEIANGTDLALDGCVFTTEYDRALRVAERIDAGAVRINGAPSHGLGDIPFGGNEKSGIGREGIGTSIEAFIRYKSIVL
ncbi:aldehyde dehydrogenase family protein [Halococcus salifodinae]|uniref:Aldehyde Dehydrogenase n=1 Tax=Halococcus salifodinae DSM 8989 TaxID=1227456 RepID=M0MRX1_9EURY|nr:aldehyde dehydrogenase family protein [Halococcus salifodinae]EMA48477.1 Aldehyde Dehydrogenase [Halococcus salifodinae DSM 8989]